MCGNGKTEDVGRAPDAGFAVAARSRLSTLKTRLPASCETLVTRSAQVGTSDGHLMADARPALLDRQRSQPCAQKD